MSKPACSYTEEQVVAWSVGDLDRRDEQAFVEHLGECPECRDEAAELRSLDLAVSGCCRDSVIRWRGFESPFGRMKIAASPGGLVELSWRRGEGRFIRTLEKRFPDVPVVPDTNRLEEAEHELEEYFSGRRRVFELPVDLTRLSQFERSVLGAASELRFGEVVPYSELARRIGRPKAARAVGNALGRNPVAIVVPCHRVMRRDGSLGGYTGGIEYKEALLRIEGREDLLRAH